MFANVVMFANPFLTYKWQFEEKKRTLANSVDFDDMPDHTHQGLNCLLRNHDNNHECYKLVYNNSNVIPCHAEYFMYPKCILLA